MLIAAIIVYGRVAVHAHRVGDVSGRALERCDGFLPSGLALKETAMPALYPQQALRGWTQPMMASVQKTPGGDAMVAALLRRNATSHPDSGRESRP